MLTLDEIDAEQDRRIAQAVVRGGGEDLLKAAEP